MSLSQNQQELLVSLKKVANEIGAEGKSLTGLIGELSVCEILDMEWKPSDGYDCIDKDNEKVQVKTRRDSKGGEVNKVGRLGKFGRKKGYQFDYGLYVELDNNWGVKAIYKASKEAIKNLEEKEKQGRGLHISTFLNKAKKFTLNN